MGRVPETQVVVRSVLDRLAGGDDDAARAPGQALRELKHSVRRDLENLLNTRWRCKFWPPDLKNLDSSLVNYGIPDICGANLTREEFRRLLEKAITIFEPRLFKISVKAADDASFTDRTLRFRVDAMLRAEPVPDPVRFDTALEPATATFTVKRVDR